MEEIWKIIENTNNKYCISNKGNIINKKKLMSKIKTRQGYLSIKIVVNNKRKSFLIHRLVASAFIPNHDNKKTVNHINGLKNDNRVENLEWATQSENNYHAYKIGLKIGVDKEKFGILNAKSKAVNQLDKNGKFIKKWHSIMDVKRELKISNITLCCKNKEKTAGGFKWEYA